MRDIEPGGDIMDHPFEVGGHYRNAKGAYQVLAFEGERMQIRYDDGAEQSVKIALQAKIWRRILDEERPPLVTYSPGQHPQSI